ncbi:hypothetical protein B296_00026473 [Ensete ventricosum]|uniref:Protein kinase domain-containing protein n=1 Tax=Ensete ventricosum TaxID=4639 RepID=A0A426ZPI7_ENSVE|nr:hypothetical protein B296_00026473 [Ensete ventricosum]
MVKEGGEEGVRVLGKYKLGRALGEGNFGKVRYARHVDSGLAFAVKILDRKRIQSLKIDDQVFELTMQEMPQIKREIGTLKLLNHPNVVRLHEVGRRRLPLFFFFFFLAFSFHLTIVINPLREELLRKIM